MAESLQNIQNLQRKVGQTWEQAFESVDKTSEAFHKLVDEFVNFVGDWKEFSDLQRDRMADYIENLGDVQGNWEKINRWVSDNTDTLDRYVGSLSDIRNLFQSIAGEVGGVRRQTIDNVNVVRNLARLANDNLAAIRQEGGLTENVVRSLGRKSTKLQEEYKARLQLMGVSEDFSNILSVQKAEERRRDAVQEELSALENLQGSGVRLNATERERLRILREQYRSHVLNLELLDEENRKAVFGLDERIKKQAEYFRAQRRGGPDAGPNALGVNRVNFASKIMSKFGLGEQARDLTRSYGEWVTKRVDAKVATGEAQDKKDLAEKQLESILAQQKAALTKSGSFTRTSNAEIRSYENEKAKQSAKAAGVEDKIKELEKELSTYRQEGNSIRNLKTGRYSTDKRVKELNSVLDQQYSKLAKIERIQKGLEKSIQTQKNLQKEHNETLGNLNRQVISAQNNVKKAQEDLNGAIKEEGIVFSKPFGLVTQIKQALGDIKGTLAAIAGILALAMWRQLLKFDEEAVKTKRVIGQWADASALANTKFVSGTEVLKTMRDLGEQFHINPVQVFSSEELGRIAQAQKLTGMTAQAAGNLAVQSRITGKNADTYRDSIAKGANQANKLNHSAVNLSAVQNDVLNTSRAIALSYGKNTEGLARAAGAAAALGTNLQGVENIAKNLMNFESSIESEMQAQLLTGQQLNLAKAREYALNNDLEGVAREVGRQGVDATRFSHMNYIQQENMAKALGMSREEMSKMLIMQEINNGLSAKQVAAMTGMKRQDIEALSAQEKWQTMKQRFLESLVPLLEPILQLTTDILIPVTRFVLGPVTWLAGLISRIGNLVKEDNVVVRGLVGILAIAIPAALLRGVGLVGGLGKAFKGLATLGVKIGKSIGGWATGLTRAGKSAQATESIFSRLRPIRDDQGRTARQRLRDVRRLDRAREINPAGAAATSKASASMGSTISKLGKNIGKIATGAAAALMIAGAVFVLAKAAKEFEGVSWESMGKAGAAILGLTVAVLALGAVMSSGAGTVMVLAGAAAMVVMAGAVWVLGNALKQVTAVPGNELQAIAGGIRAIAGAVGELAVKLGDLSVRKLNALGRAFKKLRGASIQVVSPIQNTETTVAQVSRTQEEPRESARNPRENIEAAVQEITIKQAQVQASAQQISIEQKATDLSKIEKKLDNVISAIVNSKPDWDWLEFKREFATNM